jgi:hypothetical protein
VIIILAMKEINFIYLHTNIIPVLLLKKRTIFFALVLSLISSYPSYSQPDSLFISDEIIRIELKSDFSAILKDMISEPVEHDAELIYYQKKGKSVSMPVKLEVRGNFRRNPENCDFPPLFVSFFPEAINNTVFENQERLKLVTPCDDDIDVVDEYIIYKMYNVVSPVSLKARLVKIRYIDTSTGDKLFDRYSFFIEDKDRAAKRNGLKEKDRFVTPFGVNQENLKKMAMFQYMIGNKDWFVSSRQNIIIMNPKDTTLLPYAVPYDFDFSAFVNAHYTKPKNIPADAIPDRRTYKGICYTEKEFREIFSFFIEIRRDLEHVIMGNRVLPHAFKIQLIDYIGSFYETIDDPEAIRKEFQSTCETKKDYNIFD